MHDYSLEVVSGMIGGDRVVSYAELSRFITSLSRAGHAKLILSPQIASLVPEIKQEKKAIMNTIVLQNSSLPCDAHFRTVFHHEGWLDRGAVQSDRAACRANVRLLHFDSLRVNLSRLSVVMPTKCPPGIQDCWVSNEVSINRRVPHTGNSPRAAKLGLDVANKP